VLTTWIDVWLDEGLGREMVGSLYEKWLQIPNREGEVARLILQGMGASQ
jgi:hypothetical protein